MHRDLAYLREQQEDDILRRMCNAVLHYLYFTFVRQVETK